MVKLNSATAAAEVWDLKGHTLKVKWMVSREYKNMHVAFQMQLLFDSWHLIMPRNCGEHLQECKLS
jgi:hypothetical protein